MNSVYARFKKILSAQQELLPMGYIELDPAVANRWIQEVQHIKQLIKALPRLLTLKDSEISDFYHLSPILKDVFIKATTSMDSCYRPDCIITAEGLKILEFNIDPGAMMVQTGSGPRDLLISYLKAIKSNEKDIKSAQESFLADSNFRHYLSKLVLNKKILLWDIPRSGAGAKLRDELAAALSQHGITVHFISGDEILNFTKSNDHIVFRMFSYPHLSLSEDMKNIYNMSLPFDFEHIGVKNLIYDSKINFAHMWNPEISKYFSNHDIELIKTYIPETYILDKSLDAHKLKLISDNPNDWVIKIINGFQGNNVFLGSEMAISEWHALLETEYQSGSYIVQRSIKPKSFSVKLTNGAQVNEWNGRHLLNLFFVNEIFSGFVFRFNNGMSAKIGAVNLRDTFALPVWIRS